MVANLASAAKSALMGETLNLKKAEIEIKKTKEKIPCQFNPQELTVSREVHWHGHHLPQLNSPNMKYQGGEATTCEVNLIFDTTAKGDDVRAYTNQLMRLTIKGGGKGKIGTFTEPPTVTFRWGKFELFHAIITDLKISYILFLPDGTPVRAKASVTFKQNDHDDDPKSAQNPTSRTDPRKTRVVQAGERLDMIAYEEYGGAQHWRKLAEANDLDHIEALHPGQVLIIPPLS